MAEIVATTSLPVDRLSATDCNAAARANKDQLKSEDDKKWRWPKKWKQPKKNEDETKIDTCNNVGGILYYLKSLDDSSTWLSQHNWPDTANAISCLGRI